MHNYLDNPFTKKLHAHPYRVCSRCVMDTTDPNIVFDDQGVCNHCLRYDHLSKLMGDEKTRAEKLAQMVRILKDAGRGKEYDCIMGLSGGVDSSYLAYYAVKELRIRPLVVHVDTGWNSELAVNNIENICKRLDIDLHTLVINWEEMRDLQRAYFLSGVPNLDVPQDQSFSVAMICEAKKFGVRNVLNGGNLQTESVLPSEWGYDAQDPVSLKGIHRKFGHVPLKTYPVQSDLHRLLLDRIFFRMRVHRPLEYLNYNKKAAKELLMSELGWRDYGGKHFESRFTKFFQAHYLPKKFGYDKRKAHLASLVVSGQITREDALRELELPLYDPRELEEDIEYFCKKLNLTREQYEKVMAEEPRTHRDYPNREEFYASLRNFKSGVMRVKNALLGRQDVSVATGKLPHK